MKFLAKFSKAKKIIALILAVVILVSSIFLIRSCSAPPSYEEIKPRFMKLIEDSYDVNVIIFGEGLKTYPRVSDPRNSVSVYNTGELYTDENGKQLERKVWYYYVLTENSDFSEYKEKIIAYRSSFLDSFSYAFISDKEMSEAEISAIFPTSLAAEENKPIEKCYSEVFRSEDGKNIVYKIPWSEIEYDFYYDSTDPEDYDYVSNESKYRTVDEIKAYAETVYSRSYMLSLYSTLFDGVASGDYVMKARYSEISRAGGTSLLASLNTYEPLFTERRVYDFDSASIVKLGSNSRFVRIRINSYLPSDPDKIYEDELNLVLQDGVWYLDSPTF